MTAEAESLARDLAERAGLGVPRSVERLAGGRNNRVFRVAFDGGKVAALKSYYHDPRDPRDRLKAEWGFLDYVRQRGVTNVPEPLARDEKAHAALYGFAPGIKPDTATDALVAQARQFAVAINCEPRTPRQLDAASEACFSLEDHIATVDRRVGRLRELDVQSPRIDEARAFVATRVIPQWEATRSKIVRAAEARGDAASRIETEIVSPSDFGFHNALVDGSGKATFLDFEYAGRDDPAKLICDFFSQPQLPVPMRHYEAFVAVLAAAVSLTDADVFRARILLDAYRIKWLCIMLNEFSALGAQRRGFASTRDDEMRTEKQLAAANEYFAAHF